MSKNEPLLEKLTQSRILNGWQFRLDLDSLLFLEKKYAIIKLCNVYRVERLEHCLNQQCCAYDSFNAHF